RGRGRLRFFFQAEDGIRGFHVTGVQTCALPIFNQWEGPDSTPTSPCHPRESGGPWPFPHPQMSPPRKRGPMAFAQNNHEGLAPINNDSRRFGEPRHNSEIWTGQWAPAFAGVTSSGRGAGVNWGTRGNRSPSPVPSPRRGRGTPDEGL